LLWIGFNPGAPKYDSQNLSLIGADEFHLFHFDILWFEPMLAEIFEMVDRIHLQKTGYSHVMYCLVKRESAPETATLKVMP
jgi:hypothetical protein